MPDLSTQKTIEPRQASVGAFARTGIALANWSEHWFPDAFVFALVALLVVFAAGLLTGATPGDLIRFFGDGFWSLIPFTMQMAIIIIGGYVVATSPPIYRLVRWLGRIPRRPQTAIAFVAFFSMATALISWGLSLIFSGILVREIVKNVREIDYRAIGTAGYLGTGTVWALGLSSSAALLMATPSAMPAGLIKISGVIGLPQTIYTWQSLAMAAILICSSIAIAFLSAPASSSKTAESFGVTVDEEREIPEPQRRPADWLEYSPILSVIVSAMGLAYLAQIIRTRGPMAALDLNTYNLLFLMLGLLLHWRPRSFTRSVNNAVPATAGVLIQFPFYGGIFGIITLSAISQKMAHFFVHISSHGTYPVLVALYSGLLGMFVPSGGSKWIVEAPYILQAAKDLHVNLGWTVQVYNTAEALPNLINPFWMLPLLGILKARARDLVGFGLLYLMVNGALVLFFTWLLAKTFAFVPPTIP